MTMMTADSLRTAGLKAATEPWDLKHPPQKTARAVRVHVMCTLLMFARATAYRLPCEREAAGGEPVGWQRWRCHLLEQNRDNVIVCAQGYDGIFHVAEYSRLLGAKLKGCPPRNRNPARSPGQVWAHRSWVNLMLESQRE